MTLTLLVRAPRRRFHQSRLDQVEAVEEPLDLAAAAQHQRRGRLPVDLGDLRASVRVEVAGGMGDDQVAARRHGVSQPGDDPGRVLGVPDEMQDRDQQHRHRPGQVQQSPHRRVAQDHLRLAQVGQDGQGGGLVGQQRVGMRMDHRVVVDVDDPGVRRDLLRDLVDVALGW